MLRKSRSHGYRTVVTVTDVARTTEWNPNVGPWLRAQRGKRKQDAVVADLAERGVVIGRSWLSRAENGAPMSEELLRAFEDYYGSVAPPYEPPVASSDKIATDSSGLAALVSAIGELVQELRLSRAQQDESTVALLAALAAVVPSAQVPRGTRDGTEPEAHAGTGQRP